MGKSGTITDQIRPKAGTNWSRQVDGAGLARYLRALHPDKTAAHVAAETRLPVDSVKKWLGGAAMPNGRALLVLACTYGPDALAAMLVERPDWLDRDVHGAQAARLDGAIARLRAEREGLCA